MTKGAAGHVKICKQMHLSQGLLTKEEVRL